jgi:hypothetical protein
MLYPLEFELNSIIHFLLLGYFFSVISSEASFRVAMMKSKSSELRTVCVLFMVAFDFFQQ